MFKLNYSAQDVAGRYHNICIIGVFDHPVTRSHRRQVWRVDDEGDWANSGPLYDASSYALKTWYKSAESCALRLITKNSTSQLYTWSGIFSKAIFLRRFAWRTVSKALLKSNAMTTTYGFVASMSLMVCSKVMRAAVVEPVGQNANWSLK